MFFVAYKTKITFLQMEQLLEQLATVEQNKDFNLSTSLRDVVSHDILTMIFGLQNQEVSSLMDCLK